MEKETPIEAEPRFIARKLRDEVDELREATHHLIEEANRLLTRYAQLEKKIVHNGK